MSFECNALVTGHKHLTVWSPANATTATIRAVPVRRQQYVASRYLQAVQSANALWYTAHPVRCRRTLNVSYSALRRKPQERAIFGTEVKGENIRKWLLPFSYKCFANQPLPHQKNQRWNRFACKSKGLKNGTDKILGPNRKKIWNIGGEWYTSCLSHYQYGKGKGNSSSVTTM